MFWVVSNSIYKYKITYYSFHINSIPEHEIFKKS
jgi:hypothetical protein